MAAFLKSLCQFNNERHRELQWAIAAAEELLCPLAQAGVSDRIMDALPDVLSLQRVAQQRIAILHRVEIEPRH
jgi:hypothetical protein